MGEHGLFPSPHHRVLNIKGDPRRQSEVKARGLVEDLTFTDGGPALINGKIPLLVIL